MFMLVLGTVTLIHGFRENFRLGIDLQEVKCLEHSVYLINLNEKELIPGNTYAFKSDKRLEPIFDNNTTMVKLLVGMEGDKVEVYQDYERANDGQLVRKGEAEVRINGDTVATGLAYLFKPGVHFDRPFTDFLGSKVLGENEYWFTGTLPFSFDSRYWGTVKKEQIIGRAYAII